jgi:hypothetical protein
MSAFDDADQSYRRGYVQGANAAVTALATKLPGAHLLALHAIFFTKAPNGVNGRSKPPVHPQLTDSVT